VIYKVQFPKALSILCDIWDMIWGAKSVEKMGDIHRGGKDIIVVFVVERMNADLPSSV
jgi:hypothetical protein